MVATSGSISRSTVQRRSRLLTPTCALSGWSAAATSASFSIGGWGGTKLAKTRRVGEVFASAPVVTHIYDFGTSSETQIKAVDQRDGVPLTKHPIALLARNKMPEVECIECGQPAAYFCSECQIEDETSGMLCTAHAQSHPHEHYGEPIALVNSPRLGICGYDGPADPPY